MTFKEKFEIGGIVAAVVIVCFIAYSLIAGHVGAPSLTPSAGAVGDLLAENYIPYIMDNGGFYTNKPVQFNSTEQLGAGGTARSNEVVTSCSMVADNSISATSTGYAYCLGVTGVTAADTIQAIFSTSTAAFVNQTDAWEILSAKASTTPGAIDFIIVNDTGATQVPSKAGRTASTTSIFAGH